MSCVAVASELDHSLSDQFLACMNKSDGRVQGREAGPIEVIARLSISSTSSSRGCVDITKPRQEEITLDVSERATIHATFSDAIPVVSLRL